MVVEPGEKRRHQRLETTANKGINREQTIKLVWLPCEGGAGKTNNKRGQERQIGRSMKTWIGRSNDI